MLQDYDDIKSRIYEEPKWFDEVGVPRYCKFHPNRVNDIYAKEVLLVEIACQNCHQRFKVSISRGSLAIHKVGSFKDNLEMVHYGDPPRHGDHLGETMNCIDLAILQYWDKDNKGNWVRRREYERESTKIFDDAIDEF